MNVEFAELFAMLPAELAFGINVEKIKSHTMNHEIEIPTKDYDTSKKLDLDNVEHVPASEVSFFHKNGAYVIALYLVIVYATSMCFRISYFRSFFEDKNFLSRFIFLCKPFIVMQLDQRFERLHNPTILSAITPFYLFFIFCLLSIPVIIIFNLFFMQTSIFIYFGICCIYFAYMSLIYHFANKIGNYTSERANIGLKNLMTAIYCVVASVYIYGAIKFYSPFRSFATLQYVYVLGDKLKFNVHYHSISKNTAVRNFFLVLVRFIFLEIFVPTVIFALSYYQIQEIIVIS